MARASLATTVVLAVAAFACAPTAEPTKVPESPPRDATPPTSGTILIRPAPFLQAGLYHFQVTAEGRTGSCEVQWPYRCPAARPAACEGAVRFTLETKCVTGATVAESHPLGAIRLDSSPSSVRVEIWRDTRTIGVVLVHDEVVSPTPTAEGAPVVQLGSQDEGRARPTGTRPW